MALVHSVISVNDTTPTLLTDFSNSTKASITINIQNLGAVAIYLGGKNLTTSSYGVLLSPGGNANLEDLEPGETVYALSTSGTTYVAVWMIKR